MMDNKDIIIIVLCAILLCTGIFALSKVYLNDNNEIKNVTMNNTTNNATNNSLDTNEKIDASKSGSVDGINWDEVTWDKNGGCFYKGQYYSPGQAKNLAQSYQYRYDASHSIDQGTKHPTMDMYWEQDDGYDGSYISAQDYYDKYGYIP